MCIVYITVFRENCAVRSAQHSLKSRNAALYLLSFLPLLLGFRNQNVFCISKPVKTIGCIQSFSFVCVVSRLTYVSCSWVTYIIHFRIIDHLPFICPLIELINMSQTKEEKYDDLIGVDKPPEVFVFNRLFARLRRLPLFLLRSISSPREVIHLTVFLLNCLFKLNVKTFTVFYEN